MELNKRIPLEYYDIRNTRILEMANVVALEIDGELILIKTRYNTEKTKRILSNRDELITLSDTDTGHEIDKFYSKNVLLLPRKNKS